MTSTDQTQTPDAVDTSEPDPTQTILGVRFTPVPGTELAHVAAADGTLLAAPANLPHIAGRYRAALEFGRQVHATLTGVYLPELRHLMEFVRAGHAADPYAPGGETHEHAVIVAALEAFAAVVEQGRLDAAIAAAAPPAAS